MQISGGVPTRTSHAVNADPPLNPTSKPPAEPTAAAPAEPGAAPGDTPRLDLSPDTERGQAPLSIRLRLGGTARIGPGKVALLEAIARTGELRQAAEAMGMSARRAWLLIDSLNQAFDPPLVDSIEPDGTRMQLSPLGVALIEAYRAVEQSTADAVAQRFGRIEARLRTGMIDPTGADRMAGDPIRSDPT